MPVETGLTDAEQAGARQELETSLRDPEEIRGLFNEGLLGQLLPNVFGKGEGIVGRSQGGGHEFTLDAHTARVGDAVRKEPEFAGLSETDSTGLLPAPLWQDFGKRPGANDPDHDWVGANMFYGFPGTLGYEPQRIQRIVNLVSRHAEAGFIPGMNTPERMTSDQKFADDLATHYRRPLDDVKLRILNRSDIGNINNSATYLHPTL